MLLAYVHWGSQTQYSLMNRGMQKRTCNATVHPSDDLATKTTAQSVEEREANEGFWAPSCAWGLPGCRGREGGVSLVNGGGTPSLTLAVNIASISSWLLGSDSASAALLLWASLQREEFQPSIAQSNHRWSFLGGNTDSSTTVASTQAFRLGNMNTTFQYVLGAENMCPDAEPLQNQVSRQSHLLAF